MTKITRKQDALDVVGIEYKSEVEDLDKKISLAMLEKSHFDELVEKSIALAEKDVLDTEGKDIKGITSRSETTEEITPPENTPNVNEVVSEKSETETEVEKDDMEMWLPYAGATSLADAQKFVESNDLLNKVYYAYGVFGAVASNIMHSEADVTEKVNKLNALFGEFQKSLTPEKLKEFSEVNKMDNSGVELDSVKAELETLKSLVNGLVNKTEVPEVRSASVLDESKVEKTETLHELSKTFDGMLKEVLPQEGDARKAGLQGILNRMGEEFLALNTQLETKTEKSEIAGQEVLRALVDEKIAPLANQLGQIATQQNQIAQLLSNLQKNQPTLVQTPVSKAVVNMPQNLTRPITAPVTPNGFSIRDIVKKTTTG